MGCLFAVVLGLLSALTVRFLGAPTWLLAVLGVLWLAALVVSFTGGHHGFGNGGNTDFMIVLAAFLIAVALVVPRYAARTPRGQLRASLQTLAAAEDGYFRKNGSYTTSLALLGPDAPRNPEVYVLVVHADERYFLAMASHPKYAFDNGELRVLMWNSERGGLVE